MKVQPLHDLVEREVVHERAVILDEPMPHQQEVILHPARFKLLLCGRRWGKTAVGRIIAMIGHGPTCREHRGAIYGGYVWWVMPTMPQARTTWDAFEFALRDVWTRKNATERFFDLPGGGRLQVKSADEPESLRGDGLNIIVLDELKDQPVTVYKAIRPALMDKRGSLLAMGTPGDPIEGKNLSYDLYLKAKKRKNWKLFQRPSSDNPIVTPDEIEDMREDLGEFAFGREGLAQFTSLTGKKFKRETFRYYDRTSTGYLLNGEEFTPTQLHRFATCDTAGTVKTRSDNTAIGSWGVAPGRNLLLLDVVRDKISGSEKLKKMREQVKTWGLSDVWIEENAYSSDLISIGREGGHGEKPLPIRPLVADKDKLKRAEPAMAEMEGGHVWFPRTAAWLEDFENELLAFDGAPKDVDDRVDILSYAVRVMRGHSTGGAPPPSRRREPRQYPGLDAERPS